MLTVLKSMSGNIIRVKLLIYDAHHHHTKDCATGLGFVTHTHAHTPFSHINIHRFHIYTYTIFTYTHKPFFTNTHTLHCFQAYTYTVFTHTNTYTHTHTHAHILYLRGKKES